MISWIKGDIIDLWQINNKFFILINCQNIGYEIQVLEPLFIKLKKNSISNKDIILWIKHIKKEDTDLFFGFKTRDQKNLFIEILNVRGIGSQIGMGILNTFSIFEVINAISTENKKLICSVPGIGQKMAERLIIELKSKFKNKLQDDKSDDFQIKDPEINKIVCDIQLTLKSLNYTKNEIRKVLPIIIKETDYPNKQDKFLSFENLLKIAMNYLDNNSSNIVR